MAHRGWRVGAVRHWLWAFATPETTVYAICPGRGFDDARTVLDADFGGVLVATGGRRIVASTTRCTKPAWPTCYGAASIFETTIRAVAGPFRSKPSSRPDSRCATAA